FVAVRRTHRHRYFRGLAPFPTRRSPDLTGLIGSTTLARRRSPPPATGPRRWLPDRRPDQRAHRTTAPRRARVPRPASRSPRETRSEEHTSELQSRENLVCRLLLEKKTRV